MAIDNDKVKSIRKTARKNPDGSVSSHLMATETFDGKNWVSFPTLFPKNSDKYTSDPKDWIEITDHKKAYEEAKRRGEVFEFGTDKDAALKFGKGSWKDENYLKTEDMAKDNDKYLSRAKEGKHYEKGIVRNFEWRKKDGEYKLYDMRTNKEANLSKLPPEQMKVVRGEYISLKTTGTPQEYYDATRFMTSNRDLRKKYMIDIVSHPSLFSGDHPTRDDVKRELLEEGYPEDVVEKALVSGEGDNEGLHWYDFDILSEYNASGGKKNAPSWENLDSIIEEFNLGELETDSDNSENSNLGTTLIDPIDFEDTPLNFEGAEIKFPEKQVEPVNYPDDKVNEEELMSKMVETDYVNEMSRQYGIQDNVTRIYMKDGIFDSDSYNRVHSPEFAGIDLQEEAKQNFIQVDPTGKMNIEGNLEDFEPERMPERESEEPFPYKDVNVGTDVEYNVEGPPSGDLTLGDKIAIGSSIAGGTLSTLTTVLNRLGDSPNQSKFTEFGDDAMRKLDEMKEFAGRFRDERMGDLKLAENTRLMSNRNTARGINTKRALDFGTHMTTDDARRKIDLDYDNRISQILGQEADLSLNIDNVKMAAEERADIANRQDRDAFSSNLSQDFSNMATLGMNLGRNLNMSKAGKDAFKIGNQMSNWFEFDTDNWDDFNLKTKK